MTKPVSKRGRPSKFREFDDLYDGCPLEMRRPRYRKGIGVRRGKQGDTVWAKVQLPAGGIWKGTTYRPGAAAEIKLGRKSSITWEEAISLHAELQGRADDKKPLEEAPPTLFSDFSAQWLVRARGRLKGLATDETILRVHILPFFGGKPINTVTRAEVNAWIAEGLRERVVSTVKRELNTLKAIFNDAVRAGEIPESPCDRADKLSANTARQRFLSAEEIVRLLAAAERVGTWLRDAILWALHSGMRRGEVQSMRWPDILDISGGGKVVMLATTKSGKPRRVICTTGMLEVLDRQTDRRITGDDRVFPVSKMTWRRRWEKARELAGLSDIDFHDLRRTNATQAAASGVDLRTLAARIGHTDLAMLEKHYAMVVGSAEHEAAEKIQATFDGLTENVVPLGRPK